MRDGARLFPIGGVVLLTVLASLAGCGRGMMQFGGERAAWRHEAEVDCLKSGALKQNAAAVQIKPIEGQGICGADFPLKVAALGDAPALSYNDIPRPPGAVPSGSPDMPARWPVNEPRYVPAPQPVYQWQPGPPPASAPGAPVSLAPPGSLDEVAIGHPPPRASAPPSYPAQNSPQVYRAPPPVYSPPPRTEPPRYAPSRYEAPRTEPARMAPERADDIPDDAILPDRSRIAPPREASRTPYARPLSPPPPRQEPPQVGRGRGPMTPVKAAVSPPATLSCPIVTALDKWVSEGVQPAAMRWFGQPVVEIKQISSYSCREMVGARGSHMSEHAFGNALDVAGFTLADGRKIAVKTGWNGTPEEAGFLHDVQGSACEVFSTVLAPGYNVYHYDHIHLDLMRRASGRHPCRPNAIPGEVAAAKQAQKSRYAHRGDPNVTGSVGSKAVVAKRAVPGEDGEFDDDDDDPGVTGSIGPRNPRIAVPGADGDFDE